MIRVDREGYPMLVKMNDTSVVTIENFEFVSA